MDLEEIRALCLSFPGATEDVKWGNDLTFSVGKKMFAVTGLDTAAQSVLEGFPVHDGLVGLTSQGSGEVYGHNCGVPAHECCYATVARRDPSSRPAGSAVRGAGRQWAAVVAASASRLPGLVADDPARPRIVTNSSGREGSGAAACGAARGS